MLHPGDHVLEYVDAYLHDALPVQAADYVAQHAEQCPICRVALDEARKRTDAIRSLPAAEASLQLIAQTERRLDAAVHKSRRLPNRVLERVTAGRVLALAAAAAALVIVTLNVHYLRLGPSPYDMKVLGQYDLLADTDGSLRVVVLNRHSNTFLAGIPIQIELMDSLRNNIVKLASFQTDSLGTGRPRFHIPDWTDGDYTLRVAATVGGQAQTLSRTVRLRRSWQVMLTCDKPVYQPGQVIRFRSLALRRPDLKPVAGRSAEFTVADPKGNIICRVSEVTSRFGIASAECPLADEILHGNYRIECKIEDTISSVAVQVRKYVLPKFKIAMELDRAYYQPGEMIRGTLQADYFFGKPVADAVVRVDVQGMETSAEQQRVISAKTDRSGRSTFVIRVPEFASSAHESAEERLVLKATVTDTAGQQESREVSRIVTTSPLRIEVLPEGGRLVAGVTNLVYVLTTYPDGRPARTELSVSGFDRQFTTDDSGVGMIDFIPRRGTQEWSILATDPEGRTGRKHMTFATGESSDDFLLRTDNAVYAAGQTVHFTALGAGSEPVFIDLIKDGQALLTDSIAMADGHGQYALDLPPSVFGTVEISAYRYGGGGVPVQKTRVIYVRCATALQIRAKTNQQEYRPGEKAAIELSVMDSEGHPTPGAVSLAAVDEAVYSVMKNGPGAPDRSAYSPHAERDFFDLNGELLKPVLSIHPWAPSEPAVGHPDRQRFDQAIFAAAARRNTELEAILEQNPELRHVDASWLSDRRQRGDWDEFLEGLFLSQKARKVLANDGGDHTLVGSTYLVNARESEATRREALVFVAELWGLFVVIGVVTLFLYLVWIATDRLQRFFEVLGLMVICGVIAVALLPAVQAAREAAFETEQRHNLRQLDMALGGVDRRDLPQFHKAVGAFGVDQSGAGKQMPAEQEVAEPPVVRQWFPETLLWRPEIITDDQGRARVEVDLADSITTWRLSASAVSAAGQLGASESPIRIFQPFFVDVNVPVALTRGDEIAIPVVVHNYLHKPQTVSVTLDDASWYERLDDATKSVSLAADEIRAVHYRLRARKPGEHQLQVRAQANGVADAVKRTVMVISDGERKEQIVNGTLGQSASIELTRPKDAIEGSAKTVVKIYPSGFSQLVEGLDSIFRLPYGCFEQTSSTTYPNLLALDYLRRTNTSAAVEAKARQYIQLGYQRLLSFEVPGGGFDWFGHPPANRSLTAYGLMEFEDMASVYAVDGGLISRTRAWLLGQRNTDGSWSPESHGLEGDRRRRETDDTLRTTAYIAWTVFHDERRYKEEARPTLNFLLSHSANSIQDPYILALVCNALLTIDPDEAAPYLRRLEEMKQCSAAGNLVWWEQEPGASTTFYGAGLSGNVETTALATLALLAAGNHPDTVRGALAWLIKQKDGSGTWYSTQATVLALKALLAGTGKPLGGNQPRHVRISLNGKAVREVEIPAGEFDVLKYVDLSDKLSAGRQTLQLTDLTGTAAGFQVASSYYVPSAAGRSQGSGLSVDVSYDRHKLPINSILSATATVKNATDRSAPMLIVDLPIPAGFALDSSDFAKLVGAGQIAKFQVAGSKVILYLRALDPHAQVTFQYRLQATMPATLRVPPATAYEYYNADQRAVGQPTELVVSPES